MHCVIELRGYSNPLNGGVQSTLALCQIGRAVPESREAIALSALELSVELQAVRLWRAGR